MSATLYALTLSHPSHTAHLTLDRKRVDHRVVNLLPGLHPQMLRAVGFEGRTVPALRLEGGRRVQGSLAIAAVLEELRPQPPLYPADPAAKAAVVEAERWGHDTLQAVPRHILRWAASGQPEVRRWIGGDVVGLPAPRLAAALFAPIARVFRRISDATDEHVRSDLAELPSLLDRVGELIQSRTIGGEEPNAADLQIGPSVRVLLAFRDIRPMVEGRPCAELAQRLLPDYPDPIPAEIPRAWVPGAARTAEAQVS
jgi:glutathione S-transferase